MIRNVRASLPTLPLTGVAIAFVASCLIVACQGVTPGSTPDVTSSPTQTTTDAPTRSPSPSPTSVVLPPDVQNVGHVRLATRAEGADAISLDAAIRAASGDALPGGDAYLVVLTTETTSSTDEPVSAA